MDSGLKSASRGEVVWVNQHYFAIAERAGDGPLGRITYRRWLTSATYSFHAITGGILSSNSPTAVESDHLLDIPPVNIAIRCVAYSPEISRFDRYAIHGGLSRTSLSEGTVCLITLIKRECVSFL